MSTQIAAQMYTLRQFTKNPQDMAETLHKVRAIGFEAVQLSGHGPIDVNELHGMLEREGLTVCATHIGFDRMQNELDKVMEEHRILGCKNLAIGGLPAAYRTDAASYMRFAKEASDIARKLAENGFTWSYHNHSFELERFGDRTALDILFHESDPKYFLGEIDTYWIQHGGGDPAQWVLDLKGRIKLLHLKDMATRGGKEQLMAEIGEGNLNWPRILDAAKQAGVEWYIIEQDICQRDPFESLAISFRNVKTMGLR